MRNCLVIFGFWTWTSRCVWQLPTVRLLLHQSAATAVTPNYEIYKSNPRPWSSLVKQEMKACIGPLDKLDYFCKKKKWVQLKNSGVQGWASTEPSTPVTYGTSTRPAFWNCFIPHNAKHFAWTLINARTWLRFIFVDGFFRSFLFLRQKSWTTFKIKIWKFSGQQDYLEDHPEATKSWRKKWKLVSGLKIFSSRQHCEENEQSLSE